MSASKTTSAQQAYASLMKGLTQLDIRSPAVPCHLILTSDNAFPLAISSNGEVLIAASQYGSGRIVVIGHEAYLTTLPDLVKNAIHWLRGDKSGNMLVGGYKDVKAVADNLTKSNFNVKVMEDIRSDHWDIGVYVTDAYSVGASADILVACMKAGLGILIAGQAWSWAMDHPKDNTLLEFMGNKVSAVTGIYFTDRYGTSECLYVWPEIPSSWKALQVREKLMHDVEFLLKGISEFDIRGDPVASELLCHGPLAFPIGTTEDGSVFLGAGFYGKGRVIVVSHESYLATESLTSFWDNALHWLDQGRMGVVGVEPDYALNILKKSGLKCEKTGFRNDLSVFVRTVYSEDHLKEIQEFVAEGGGLLIGGHVWYWTYVHPDQNYLKENVGNKMLNTMGFSLLSNTIWGGRYKAPDPSKSVQHHFRHLLYRFAGHVIEKTHLTEDEEKCLKKLGSQCATFMHLDDNDCCAYTQLVIVLTDILKRTGLPQVSEKSPVTSPEDHLLLSVAAEVYKVCPNQDELLPYLIKDIPQLPTVNNQRITINVNTADGEEWVSTGLYLSPGMKTYMAIPADIINKGWKVQVGCQTDTLAHEALKRAPTVFVRVPITSEMMQVYNLWGGLIYLIAPPKTQVTGAEVVVQVSVPAPYYKSGVTSLADWSSLRSSPAPWAELEFENIILTVPSDEIRDLDRLDELAAQWDSIMRAVADLAVIPHKFPRKERIICDVQISAGWLHAGYPVMAHTPTAKELVCVNIARTEGMWGPIHELGHNQQRGCWEFPPYTGECTNNLWSVYVHEEVLNVPRGKAQPALTLEERKRCIEKWVRDGRKLSDWSVFVALETYLQLQEKFGWDAFKKVFGAYHKIHDVPDDNKGKMNLWAETFSKAVGMNLCDFLKCWSWPIEADTEKKLSNLPSWTDHPMVKYN